MARGICGAVNAGNCTPACNGAGRCEWPGLALESEGARADAALAAIEAAGWVMKRREAVEDMEATLEAYVSDFCEGFCAECDLDSADKIMLNDCSGCRARVTLAKAAPKP